jgi:hypothetical protein
VIFATAIGAAAAVADGGSTGGERGDGNKHREDEGLDVHAGLLSAVVAVCLFWAAGSEV